MKTNLFVGLVLAVVAIFISSCAQDNKAHPTPTPVTVKERLLLGAMWSVASATGVKSDGTLQAIDNSDYNGLYIGNILFQTIPTEEKWGTAIGPDATYTWDLDLEAKVLELKDGSGNIFATATIKKLDEHYLELSVDNPVKGAIFHSINETLTH